MMTGGDGTAYMGEKMDLKKADMGDVIKDFYKSDAPQFKGRSKEKRREMAIAAKLEADEVKEGVGSVVKGGLKLLTKSKPFLKTATGNLTKAKPKPGLLGKAATKVGGALTPGYIGYEIGKDMGKTERDNIKKELELSKQGAAYDQGYYQSAVDSYRKQIEDMKKKSVKEDNIQEILDKKDIPHVKKLVGKLRKGSKTHAKQADDLEKAMKENTAIESELVIQDWNKDDIKFTEIETVDIIKAKPLKENRNTMGAEKQLTKNIESIKGQKIEIPDNTRGGPNYSPIKPKIKDKNKFPKVKIKTLKDFEKEAMSVRTEQKSNWRDELDEDWQKVNRKDKTDGLSKKAVKAYRRENPGSKLQTAVTKDPKKLKKGSKSAKRRLSFCRRMKGMKKKLTSAKTRRDPDSRINKALRRWNC